MKRKLLSVLLTLCLAFSLLPTAALAEGEGTQTNDVAQIGSTKYASLADALANAADDATVTLLADVTENVTINKSITLDLGGKTLTNTSTGKATISVTGGTVTVKNGAVMGGSKYYNIEVKNSNANLTLEDVTATAGNTGSSMIDNYGDLTIKSGTYTGGLNTIKNEPNAKLTITGGTFTLEKGNSDGFTGVVFNYGELNISGGKFIQSDKSAPYGQAQVIHTDKSGSSAPSTIITGGTFKNLCTRSTAWMVRVTNAAAGSTKVSGGTFNKKVSASYLADGYTQVENADGMYSTDQYVAKIGTTGYKTLAAAITAANESTSIKTITSSGGCGVYISGSTSAQANAANQNGAGGYQKAGFTGCTISGAENGVEVKYTDLTLDGCTVKSTSSAAPSYSQNNNGSAASGFAVVSTDNAMNNTPPKPEGTITITGNGNYNGPVGLGTLVKATYTDFKDATIQVSGGTFSSAVLPEYCADGFVPKDNGNGTFGVKADTSVAEVNGKKYETLQAAIDKAPRNATVTLLADTRENVTIDKAMTLDLNGHTLNGSTGERKPALTITARTVTIKDSSEAQTGTIMREDTAENSGVSSHYVIDIQGNAWVMFESGKVMNNSGNTAGKGASLVRVGDDSVDKYPGLNIKGGTFTQDNFIVIKVDSGDLFLNGGTLNCENSYAVEDWHRATIKGGTVNGTVAAWTYSGGHNSTLTISGGTVNGDVAAISYDGSTDKKASVSITGGTVNGTLGTYTYSNGLTATEDATKATIAVTGGTFKNDPSKYVVEDSAVSKNDSDGTYGVAKAYLAKVGDTSYYTMDEAFKAQTTSGEPILLLRDYTTGSTFNSGTINRTVDLNGHTWTCTGTDANSAAFEINNPNVTLTVKNGKIVSSQLVGLIPSAMGGTIKYDNSGLVFEGVEMSTTATSGIETNGNNTNDTVTLKNSKLNVPNGFGIYFPSSGTLTIDNSTITAKTMGVQVCAGSLNINDGSKITVTGDAVPKAENDGAIQDGAAISIVNRPGYKGLVNIGVTGGTFKANGNNAAIKAYDWNNATKMEETFTESTKVSVSGGTFSSAVKAEYCAPGFVPKANSDGTYGVTRPSSGSSGSYDPTYSVSTPSKTEHGTVTVSPKSASKGDTVTVTVKPDSGYVLETLTVTDKNGNELTLKDKGNGKYTFTMPAGKVEVKATFMEDNSMLNFFYDVPNNAYFYEAVKWAVKNGITTGVGNDLFAPEQPCTRAQIVTFLWRAAGSPEPKGASSFADVAAGSYYAKAVAWAVENGITTGTGDGKFSPDATCTRAQAVTFLARALNAKASGKAEFSDVPADSYFADAVAWAAANGVTEGIGGGLFGSDNDCTRGQIVTFLYRAYNK